MTPSTGDLLGEVNSLSYLINTPTANSAQPQPMVSPQNSTMTNASSPLAPVINFGDLTPSTGTVGVSYSGTIMVTGSSGITVTNPTLPAGWTATQSASGGGIELTISGTPTTKDTISFTVTAQQGNQQPVSRTYDITIAPATTTTSASVSPTTVAAGGSVDVSATVLGQGGNPATEGSVFFTLTRQGITIDTTAAVNSSGKASATVVIPDTAPSGLYDLTAYYTDPASNYKDSSTESSGILTVNNTQVVITGSMTPTTLTASSSDQSVNLSATVISGGNAVNTGTVTFTGTLDGQPFSVTGQPTGSNGHFTGTLTVPGGTGAGTCTVQVSYTDNSGTHTATVGTLTINAAPVSLAVSSPTIDASPDDQSVNLIATVTSGGNAVNTGTVTFTGTLNGQPFSVTGQPTGSNGQFTGTLTVPGGTPKGTYTVTADYAANGIYGTASTTSTLKNNPAALNLAVGNPTISASASDQTVTLTATVTSGGNAVNTGTVTFTGTLNGQPFSVTGQPTGSNGQFTGTLMVPGGTATGGYTVTANYVDDGIYDSASNTGTLTINPVQNLIISPSSLPAAIVGVAYDETITATSGFGGVALATNPSPIVLPAGLNYTINGNALTISGTPTASGSVTFDVTATDAGGRNLTRNYTLTVNSPIPSVTINPPPSGAQQGTPVTITGSFTDPAGAAYQPYNYTWTAKNANGVVVGSSNGTVNYSSSGSTKVGNFTFTPPNNGTYTITLQVTDHPGTSGSATQSLPVGNVAPTVNIVTPSSAQEGSPVTMTGSFTDPAGALDGPYSYVWTAINSSGGIVSTASGSVGYPSNGAASVPNFTFTPADNGSYVITLRITDLHGASGNDTQSLMVGNVAPSVSIITPSGAQQGSPVAVTGSFTDPGGVQDEPYNYVWTATNSSGAIVGTTSGTVNYPASGAATVPSFTFTPLDNGNYTVTLQVTDVHGAIGSDSHTLLVANVTPMVSIVTPSTAQEGSAVTVTGSFTDPAGALDGPYSYVWTATNASGTVVGTTSGTVSYPSTGAAAVPDFTFTPADNGMYTVTLQITDAHNGSGSDTHTLSVGNVAPTVSVAPVASVQAGTSVTATGSFTDPAGAADVPYSYTWTVLDSSGAVVRTQSGQIASYPTSGAVAVPNFTFTPANAGTYTISLTVADKNGVSSLSSQSLTVTSPPAPPPSPSFPPLVFTQMTIDVNSLPDWNNPQGMATLENVFWAAYAISTSQSSSEATALVWEEFTLSRDLLLAGGNPALLVNNANAIALANDIFNNPLYHTWAGWVMANYEMERLLLG